MHPWQWPTYGEWALGWLALMVTPAAAYYTLLLGNMVKILRRDRRRERGGGSEGRDGG